MASKDLNDVQINRVHNGAICTEIGERLSAALTCSHGTIGKRHFRRRCPQDSD